MTGQERDYEAILSRVLHTTTDRVEPVGDGLTKIRARLGEPWLNRQWWLLRSEFMVLRWLVVVRCESLASKIRASFDVTDLAPDAPAGQEADGGPLKSLLSMATSIPPKGAHRSVGPAMAWFRPALAVAGAVVLVVAGVFALGSVRAVVGHGVSGTGTTNSAHGNGNGNPYGSGTQIPGSGTSSQGTSGTASSQTSAGHSKADASTAPCEGPSSAPQSSPSPSPTSPSPSPTTSPSPSPTPTSPSPSPTTSTSQAPMTGAVPSHTSEPIGTTALVVCGSTPAASPSPTNQLPTG